MDYDTFIGQVQHRGRLASREAAVRAIRSTLETLAERLTAGEADDLAAQLPHEIGEYLRHSAGEAPQRFSSHDFLVRVGMRAQVGVPGATYYAQVVIDVLQDAVSPGEIRDVLAQLPEEFRRLFKPRRMRRMLTRTWL